jgi:hypothetical protein
LTCISSISFPLFAGVLIRPDAEVFDRDKYLAQESHRDSYETKASLTKSAVARPARSIEKNTSINIKAISGQINTANAVFRVIAMVINLER